MDEDSKKAKRELSVPPSQEEKALLSLRKMNLNDLESLGTNQPFPTSKAQSWNETKFQQTLLLTNTAKKSFRSILDSFKREHRDDNDESDDDNDTKRQIQDQVKIQNMEGTIEKLNTTVSQQKHQLEEADETIQSLRNEIHDKDTTIQLLQNEIQLKDDKHQLTVKEMHETKENLARKISEFEKAMCLCNAEVKLALRVCKEDAETADVSLSFWKAQRDVAASEAEYYKRQVKKLENVIHSLEEQISSKDAEQKKKEEEIESMKEEILENKRKLEKVIESHEDHIQIVEAKLNDCSKEKENATSDAEEARRRLAEVQEMFDSLERERGRENQRKNSRTGFLGWCISFMNFLGHRTC